MRDKRRTRKRPGGPPQNAKRQRYLRLINEGVSNSEACRQVGINRKTGTRWRYGRHYVSTTGAILFYPPVVAPRDAEPISDRYLSADERLVIADGVLNRRTQQSIAEELGRSPSTISRELKRNTDPATGRYTPHVAHKTASHRRCRPKPRKLEHSNELRKVVEEGLKQCWSPEQISRRLHLDFPGRPDMRIAPETIYQTLYDRTADCLDQCLYRRLRTGRRARKRRFRGERQHRGFIAPTDMVKHRPADADDRVEPGHWEGDLIIGLGHQSAIGTLVERVTRYTILVYFEGPRTADLLRDCLIGIFDDLPDGFKKSLTWDQGTEMARHRGFTEKSAVPVFFCQASSPWQRGTNENTNGLLRQYFPKHTDLSVYDADDLEAVAGELNARPRKTLGWRSPAECVDTMLA